MWITGLRPFVKTRYEEFALTLLLQGHRGSAGKAGKHEDRRPQSVGVFKEEQGSIWKGTDVARLVRDVRQGGIEGGLRNESVIQDFPHSLALQALNPADAPFGVASAFQMALQKLQCVDAVNVEAGIPNGHRRFNLAAKR